MPNIGYASDKKTLLSTQWFQEICRRIVLRLQWNRRSNSNRNNKRRPVVRLC
ncbi:hypothetical protein CR513_28958 [Mucuna pruriens]|uniref:Uncharacterized protein n=1 Tax=Mucuna pruriens TaxID=157652 RepID=A0A371GFH4_MUCPR|nr:hypothetical protein CR513_28958 [Mucuna pruriens]